MTDSNLVDVAVSAMIANIRPSRAGWKREAGFRLTAEVTLRLRQWREAERVAAYAATRREAAEKEASERLLPVWGVKVERGSHSFSGDIYGAQPRKGFGKMTWAEAQEEAEAFERRHAKKIRRDSDFFQECLG